MTEISHGSLHLAVDGDSTCMGWVLGTSSAYEVGLESAFVPGQWNTLATKTYNIPVGEPSIVTISEMTAGVIRCAYIASERTRTNQVTAHVYDTESGHSPLDLEAYIENALILKTTQGLAVYYQNLQGEDALHHYNATWTEANLPPGTALTRNRLFVWNGQLLSVWVETDTTTNQFDYQFSILNSDGTWSRASSFHTQAINRSRPVFPTLTLRRMHVDENGANFAQLDHSEQDEDYDSIVVVKNFMNLPQSDNLTTEAPPGGSVETQLRYNSQGDILAAWQQYHKNDYIPYAAIFNGSGWSDAFPVSKTRNESVSYGGFSNKLATTTVNNQFIIVWARNAVLSSRILEGKTKGSVTDHTQDHRVILGAFNLAGSRLCFFEYGVFSLGNVLMCQKWQPVRRTWSDAVKVYTMDAEREYGAYSFH